MKRRLDRFLPVLSGIALILGWYALRAAMSTERRFLLPAPHEILKAFRDKGPELWTATLNSASGAALGFATAVAMSFLLALLLSLSPRIRASIYPYLMVLQMTPIIVLAPILILWVGPGWKSVVIITFLICFFPMVVNTTQGLISADRNLVDFFQMCQATRRQEVVYLRVPSALPYFFTGLRIAGTLAPIGAIVGDAYAGNSGGGEGGLGFLTIVYSARFEMGALFATALLSCLLGFIFVGAVVGLSWFALHNWHDSFNKADH